MSTQYIQLKNPSGDLLYPRTDWAVILNRPSFATVEQVLAKQDKLTSANSGPGILIETVEGVLRISATNATNYATLTNKPCINGVELNGSLTAADLNIAQLESTDTGDWEVADEVGNVILRLVDGHILTKYFDSRDLPTALSQFTNDMNFLSQATLDSALATFKTSTLDPIYVTHTGFSTDLASALGTAVSPNYDLGIFSNAAGYLKPETLQQYFVAGANIQISRSGNVMTISATGGGGSGGTSDYNQLINRPSLNGITLAYGQTFATFGLPHIATTTLSALDVVDESNNAVFRITNEGHIRSKEFDSSNIQGVDIKSGETGSYATNGYVLTANGFGFASWQPQSGGGGGMTNPMQDSGDLIIGGGGGTPIRLVNTISKSYLAGESGNTYWTSILGTDIKSTSATAGTVLTADGNGNAYWGAGGSGGGMVNPMTAVGDIIYGGTNGAPTRLTGGTDNMGKVLTIWADGEPHWADTQHRFTGSTSGVGVVVSVGTNQLSSSAASANNYVLYWSNGPVWGRINPASINTGSSVIGDVIVSSGSAGSATWGKVPGTSISSLSATNGQVLTADGNGYTVWSTPSATVQTNASLSYQDNNIIVDSNAITAFTTYALPSNCTQVVITVKHSVYDSSTEGYSWETNTITLDSSASIWTDFPDDPDGYYCTFTFVPGSLTFTDYGEGAQRWNLDNDDDPEIYAYACPEYTAYRIETQLGVTPPPLLDTFTMQSTITSQAVLAAIAAGSPFYISGTALNSALNAGVQDIPYLFTQSYVTTGITYVCLIEGYKWIALTYLDNAFIGYVIRDLSVQLYLHTISANANNTTYTFRFLDTLSTQITSGAALAQHNKARLIGGFIIGSSTVGDVRSCGYDPATEMLYLTVALSSGVTTLPIPINNFQAWYDSVQTWS